MDKKTINIETTDAGLIRVRGIVESQLMLPIFAVYYLYSSTASAMWGHVHIYDK